MRRTAGTTRSRHAASGSQPVDGGSVRVREGARAPRREVLDPVPAPRSCSRRSSTTPTSAVGQQLGGLHGLRLGRAEPRRPRGSRPDGAAPTRRRTPQGRGPTRQRGRPGVISGRPCRTRWRVMAPGTRAPRAGGSAAPSRPAWSRGVRRPGRAPRSVGPAAGAQASGSSPSRRATRRPSSSRLIASAPPTCSTPRTSLAGELDQGRGEVGDVDRAPPLVLEERARPRPRASARARAARAATRRRRGSATCGRRPRRGRTRAPPSRPRPSPARRPRPGRAARTRRRAGRPRRRRRRWRPAPAGRPTRGGRARHVGRTGGRDLAVGLDVGRVDDRVGSVPREQRVDRGAIAHVGVGGADGDDLVAGRGRLDDVAAEVAGAATRDEEPHQGAVRRRGSRAPARSARRWRAASRAGPSGRRGRG